MTVVRLKAVATLNTAVNSVEERPLLSLDLIESGTGKLVKAADVPVWRPPASGVAEAKPGDVLFGKLRPYLSKSLLVEAPSYASTELLCLRPTPSTDSRWLAYVVQSRPFVDWTVATSDGTKMPRTSWEKASGFRVDQPGIAEQRSIADFLDAETARIDALIARKRRLIDLLDERATAHIEARMCEWSNEERPLRRLLSDPPQYGAGESGESSPAPAVSWPRYIRITDLRWNGVLADEDVRVLAPALAAPYMLKDGDLLFARSGATVGKSFRYQLRLGPACFAGYLIRLRFDRAEVLPSLVDHWTQTGHYWDQIRGASVQATIENVSAERYKELLFPLPPRAEQDGLVAEFDRVRRTSRRAGESLSVQIDLLVERRQALITAAVTGELAVPGAA
ncbi:MAG: hypothetical protein KDB10_04680 [Acidimicrobiales bacterium]|nr:hypothetical protein [Acidimicrobiales bacterium]